jgi:hypothetical protein
MPLIRGRDLEQFSESKSPPTGGSHLPHAHPSSFEMGRFLGFLSAGGAVAAAGSIVPSITLTEPRACASSDVFRVLDHRLKLLARQVLDRIAVLDRVFARDQHGDNFQPHPRLVAAHFRNSLFSVLAEIAQERANDLLA